MMDETTTTTTTNSPKKSKNRTWKTDSEYVGKEIRRVLPAQFLTNTTTTTPQFVTGKITHYLPSSTMHPRQPTLFHIEYYLPYYPSDDISFEEVENGLQLNNKRLSNCITTQERNVEEAKIVYFKKQSERNELNDALRYMKDVLLEPVCIATIDDLEDEVIREREKKASVQQQEHRAKSSKEEVHHRKGLPEYYSSYPKKAIKTNSTSGEKTKTPVNWFSLNQIYTKIQSSLDELYTTTTTNKKKSTTSTSSVATRRSLRKVIQYMEEESDVEEEEEEEEEPIDKINALLSEHTQITTHCSKADYRPTLMELLAVFSTKIIPKEMLVCKQMDLLQRKIIKDEELFGKSIQFRKKPLPVVASAEENVASEKQQLEQVQEMEKWDYNVWRFNCIQVGNTKWEVSPALPSSLQNTILLSQAAEDVNITTDIPTTTLSRRTKKSIFYGGSSGKYVSISQIIDTVFRLVCKTSEGMSFCTLESIVCGAEEAASESIVSSRKKMPKAFLQLLYHFGKVRRFPIQIHVNVEEDALFWKYERNEGLGQYIHQIQMVEHEIRSQIVKSLSFDFVDISSAADGCVPDDETPIEDVEDVEWRENHSYKEDIILRPNKDGVFLSWKVGHYTPSVLEHDVITRRKWYKITSVVDNNNTADKEKQEETMIITENQISAGKEAYELSQLYPRNNKQQQHSWLLDEGISIKNMITADEEEEAQFATIVGYHPILNNNDTIRILILYDDVNDDASSVWKTLHLETNTIQEENDTTTTISFHNPKYSNNAQIQLLSKLKDQAKISPFLHPVDPIELELPDYNDVIKHPMDITTLETNVLKLVYDSEELTNQQFQDDLFLIFNNALLYNPSSSWICKDAKILKRFAEKELSLQVSAGTEEVGKSTRQKMASEKAIEGRNSKYYIPDSDTSDSCFSDNDYKSRSSRKRKKAKKKRNDDDDFTSSRTNKRDNMSSITNASDVIETYKSVPTYTNPSFLEKMNVANNAHAFILEDEDWYCQYQCTDDDTSSAMEYHHKLKKQQLQNKIPSNREEVEVVLERFHEEYYAKLFYDLYTNNVEEEDDEEELNEDSNNNGQYSNHIFPPYLGHINPNTQAWEIRTPYLIPAIQYILRGLVSSGHISYDTLISDTDNDNNTTIHQESNSNSSKGSIVCNHIYYYNPTTMEPFDVVVTKKLQAESEEESEEEEEITEYERLRRERVARNQERLKSLGLT